MSFHQQPGITQGIPLCFHTQGRGVKTKGKGFRGAAERVESKPTQQTLSGKEIAPAGGAMNF